MRPSTKFPTGNKKINIDLILFNIDLKKYPSCFFTEYIKRNVNITVAGAIYMYADFNGLVRTK